MARSPLFDYYDPYGELEMQAQMGLLPPDEDDVDELGMPAPRSRPQISDLMPQEQQSSMLHSLASGAMSGLQLAGSVLGAPGRLVRSVLSGDPGAAFGGIEDDITGRDLLRKYGLIGPTDSWLNFAGGLATEIVLDPLLYFNPFASLGRGALTKAVGVPLRKAGMLRNPALDAARGFGQTAAAAVDDIGDAARIAGEGLPRLPGRVAASRKPTGVREYLRNLTPQQAFDEARQVLTPDEFDEAMARFVAAGGDIADTRGAAGLMSFNVPGTGIQYDISGGAFGDMAAKVLDSTGEWSKRAPVIGPLTRGFAAAFDSRVGYTLDPDAQMAHRRAYAQAQRNEERLRRHMGVLERDALGVTLPDNLSIDGADIPLPERFRAGFASQDLQNALAYWLESPGVRAADNAVSTLGSPSMAKTSGDSVADFLLENIPEYRAMRESLASLPESARVAARSRGLPLPDWTSRLADTEWFPRQNMWFAQEDLLPEQLRRMQRPHSRGSRLFSTADNFGRSRELYTDVPGGRRTLDEMTGGTAARQLQDDLLKANNTEAPGIIDAWFDAHNLERPYQSLPQNAGDSFNAQSLKIQLADLIRGLDRKYADKGVGLYTNPVFSDAMRYASGQARVSAFTDEIISELRSRATKTPAQLVQGGRNVALTKAAEDLGFDANRFADLWRNNGLGDISQYSIDKQAVQSLSALTQTTRLGMPESAALRAVDSFTKLFKTTALAWPAFHTRNLYSNAIAMLAGESSPMAMTQAYRATRGNLEPIAQYLADAPIYRDLSPQARAARFSADAAEAGVGMGKVFDDVTAVPEQSFARLTPGMSPENDIAGAARGLLGDSGRTWRQFLRDLGTIRGVGVSRPATQTRNPVLRLNEAVGNTVEDTTRLAMFADLLKKGYAPGEAGDTVRRFLIDYSPQAFTPLETDFLKRAVPFYSFQRGMVPAVADSLLYRPGNVQGQSIRAISRASQPSEDNFTPEKFRRASAIPLPYFGNDGLARYLTNIDLPWESTFNLLTPGVGDTYAQRLGDTLQETASNVLGQTNPLIKAPLEYITDRQLYSGARLSDVYSVLESQGVPGGRGLEQLLMNFVPFGSRALGLYRQLSDKRLDTGDRLGKAAINMVAGVKLTDVDPAASKERAARQMLQETLRRTPGVRTYENVAIDDESLSRLTPEQRDRYLLYKIIQSQSAKRARQRRAAEADPLEALLGG
jgi:hypothetical protein